MQRRFFWVMVAALTLSVASLCVYAPVAEVRASHRHARARLADAPVAVPQHGRPPTGKQSTGKQSTGKHALPSQCRAGLVALTFDDGPSATVTPTLVKVLRKHHVPATFFMVGSRIHSAPSTARLVQRSGFTIGNHTWSHAQLTRLSDPAVRRQLRTTAREMRAHKITPSDLMRPPYGDISRRVRADIRELGLVPVLWTIDSRDWAGGTPDQIKNRILSALRPHRTNIVLQHDGVTNSPNSVAAVAGVVKAARQRGFCFTHIGPRGGPALPTKPTTPKTSHASRLAQTPFIRRNAH